MQVIPVLDLLDGHVVRAVRGERSAYLPIRSSLAATSEPLAIARALLAASGARTLYIADLGAILQQRAHIETLAALRAALPGIDIWLDAGYADFASMQALFARIDASNQHPQHSQHPQHALATLVPVFGTESLQDIHALRAAETAASPAAPTSPILSLDHRAGELLSAAAVHERPEPARSWWPRRVIAMTLDQVGSYDGPDLATFERIRASAPADTQVIGAGGIRDRGDLTAAARTGASAWLVASALHDGRIGLPLAAST
ncbi:HisA/HisF-related TIM barrel protein [Paraburkholderia graminis]|jgi:phosphoribosylformimino-5-aminoimidazole carboxamide ribotide isomerase|uniref:Phosphoribosylformimino-5-aminoimidazole carboxamide ribotide isomerase n=1 Tax=Paraburkholderia graminis TaxID=60548 RepID=A0ABD5CMS6_9BURK|nr:HisA/HisF-related TIM barrel protein [Paraburkholderia graminis]MDQ0625006.1 phosphoribosylformimino-5-aminoimidazole carboxamide ribotide isomerase [Paraburkholderia graminis]MDR6206161.1 phosphoribosylformimino-5-aminoimidazole carboxamide ribotide isomerase [Paraburkholderia graminis]